MALVLGIETSCDETGVAVFDTTRGLLGHRLYSQVAMHADFGGVVPELAARDHVVKLTPLVADLCGALELELGQLDAIAYTAGPGLVGALLVGACTAQAMAMALDIPAVPVHHMEGHLLAPLLEDDPPGFPFIALLVSGGHSMLVDVAGIGQYELLGETLDDAAGEAFDKTATLLGLGYPGGPAVARLAESGDPNAIRFPRPMTNRPGLDFSFSGLKTHVLTTWRESDQSDHTRADVAAGFQQAVADTLTIKCRRAMQQTGRERLIVAGGVGANRRLREVLETDGQKHGYQVFYPRLEFCTDNGAMIAYAGALRLEQANNTGGAVEVFPRWPLEQLSGH